MTDLGTLGGIDSQAYSVNSSGVIVGLSANSAGYENAFSDVGGVMTDLGTLGGNFSLASGVNSSGFIVGTSSLAISGEDAFVDFGGVMTDLNSVTSADGTDMRVLNDAWGISDDGFIVGDGTNSFGADVAYLLTPTDIAPTETLANYSPPPTVPDRGATALYLGLALFLLLPPATLAQSPSDRRMSLQEVLGN